MTDTTDEARGSIERKNVLSSLVESRRSYLKTAGTTGVGLIGLTTAVNGEQEEDDTVEIATTKRVNENGEEIVLRSKEVPRQWYQQIKKARQVNGEIKNQYLSNDVVQSIGITSYEEYVGYLRKHAIIIRLKKNKDGKPVPDFPDERKGIPIIVKGLC